MKTRNLLMTQHSGQAVATQQVEASSVAGGLDRFLREAEVLEVTSLARSTLWREVKAKRFPSPVPITPGRVGWRASEVVRWQQSPTEWKPQGAA
jgi:prophage regulatory protein